MPRCRNIGGNTRPCRQAPRANSAAQHSASVDTAAMETGDKTLLAVKQGLAIQRPLSPAAAVRRFVAWMNAQEFVGERTWRALLDFYSWHCEEESLVPLPASLLGSRFATELAKMCSRGQVQVRENGRVQRLTTYTIAGAEIVSLVRAA